MRKHNAVVIPKVHGPEGAWKCEIANETPSERNTAEQAIKDKDISSIIEACISRIYDDDKR